MKGDILLYNRGPKGSDCKFQEKVEEANRLGASAVLIGNYHDSVFNMAGNGTYFSKIPAIMISRSNTEVLAKAGRAAPFSVKIYDHKVNLFDWCVPTIGSLAVFVLWLSAEASYSVHKSESTRGSIRPARPVIALRMQEAVGFVFIATAMLTFLYFAIN